MLLQYRLGQKTILVWSFYKLRPHAMTARPSLDFLIVNSLHYLRKCSLLNSKKYIVLMYTKKITLTTFVFTEGCYVLGLIKKEVLIFLFYLGQSSDGTRDTLWIWQKEK